MWPLMHASRHTVNEEQKEGLTYTVQLRPWKLPVTLCPTPRDFQHLQSHDRFLQHRMRVLRGQQVSPGDPSSMVQSLLPAGPGGIVSE